jgi:hypothetical protein
MMGAGNRCAGTAIACSNQSGADLLRIPSICPSQQTPHAIHIRSGLLEAA